MLDDAFPDFERLGQAREAGMALVELAHDAQSMEVVIETVAMPAHQDVEGALSGMSKGRMSYVVHQSQCFHQVFIQVELGSDGPGNLRHFNGVGQAIAKMIRV